MGRFTGKTAIVTGAASGIGRAAARQFAAEGASVIAFDRDAGAEAVAEQIRTAGGNALALIGDAGSEADVDRVVALALGEFGRLDAFFANAAVVGGIVPFDDLTVDDWNEVLRVNLVGPFLAIQKAARAMAPTGGGAIVCTASVAGLRASPRSPSHYGASKAGVVNLVQSAAVSLAAKGVRVNAVCPGFIQSGMTQAVFDEASAKGETVSLGGAAPIDRAGQPEEIARAAVFLASDEASYINGHAMVVDGGMTALLPGGAPRTE